MNRTAEPSNADLAREATITNDCERQVALAAHPSEIVRLSLTKNPMLCEDAVKALGDEIELLRRKAREVIEGIE